MSDIPENCSLVTINVSKSRINTPGSSVESKLEASFQAVQIHLRDIIINADQSHLQTTGPNSDEPSFQLKAGFTIEEGLEFPVNVLTISNILEGMLERDKPVSSHGLANVYDSILHLQPSDPERVFLLNLIGDVHLNKFERFNIIDELDKAVNAYHQACQGTFWDETMAATSVSNYGRSLLMQYMQHGDMATLNQAVLKLQEALMLTPDEDPDKPSLLNNLGTSLLSKFEQTGDMTDLNESLLILQEAIQVTPNGQPDKPFLLNNLGNSLLTRFEQTGSMTDLNESILKFQEAVHLTPDGDHVKPSLLNNLGNSLLTRFEQTGVMTDLNDSVLKGCEAIQLTPDGNPDKPTRLNNLGRSFLRRFEQTGDMTNLNESVLKLQEAVQLTPDGHPDKPSCLNSLGSSLLRRFEQTGDMTDLNESLLKKQEAVQLTPDGHPDKPLRLNNLGNSLLRRFEQTGDMTDLNESVLKKQEAVQLTPDNHAAKPSLLNDLGASLLTRFEQTGDMTDLNESVLKKQEAVQLTSDGHPDKPSRLNNLGSSLLRRFEQIGDMTDINESVLKFQEAVQLTPDGHPDKPSGLNNLGTSLLTKFEQTGDMTDLNESVLKKQEAVQLTPDGHSDKPSRLNNLGSSLLTRFEQTGDMTDLNESVLKFQETVQLTPDNHTAKPSRLNNLGTSLLRRFEQTGDMTDLNESVLKKQEAVQLTLDGHPHKSSWLNSLGSSLLTRFEQTGDMTDLNKSVLKKEEAVQLTPDGHPDKSSRLNDLGNSLLRRFEQTGDMTDVNESVLKFQEAVQLTPDGHPGKPSLLNNLGSSLLRRFEQTGDMTDLNESALKFQEAVQLTPDGHPDKPSWLNNLGSSLLRRFQQTGDMTDLNESVLKKQEAVQLTPDGHPDKPSWLNNLGSSLLTRFEKTGDMTDLNESLLKTQEAVQLTPDGHPDKPSRLNNLGSSLLTRFEQTGDMTDINESVLKKQEAVQLTPDGHPDKSSWLNNLGNSLLAQFHQTESSHNVADLMNASLAYSSAAHAEYGPPSVRLHAARLWASCLHILPSTSQSILDPYHTAISLLSEIAWLGSSLPDRHHQIMQAGNVVHEAAASAYKLGNYTQAVEWLEQGRSVIWGQLLQLRTPLDDLAEKQPKLCQKLERNTFQLEQLASHQAFSFEVVPHPSRVQDQAHFKEQGAHHGHQLAVERKQLLTEIRMCPGFERFLLSRQLVELTPAASHGPIVILSPSEIDNMCYALILHPNFPEDVLPVSLESFSAQHAKSLYSHLYKVLHEDGRINSSGDGSIEMLSGDTPHTSRNSAVNQFKEVEEALCCLIINNQENTQPGGTQIRKMILDSYDSVVGDEFKKILAELWEHVAKPILAALELMDPSPNIKPHIWWCSTGLLSFLPIHAAGLYGKDAPAGSKLSDFVISSYIPTISALLDRIPPPSSIPEKPRLLAVAQSSSFDQNRLPGAVKEIGNIEQAIGEVLTIKKLTEENATLQNVVSEIQTSTWVHFACHGVQNATHPLQSALLLAGKDRLTLEHLTQLKLTHCGLAFLSACQTAKGDEKLSDEAVHLGAGMLAAGFQGVIATMWSVDDNIAPKVARDVYQHLKESELDVTEAAHGLHLAVENVRKEIGGDDNASLMSWVPFIHIGR
ncbi:hypothetical protein M422DRAFT_240443 [Sphaerobolus stellatus SS14]|nr:hypothetical protein M422DRAFT_240443 [Sphaerobolus stellatus SS14]